MTQETFLETLDRVSSEARISFPEEASLLDELQEFVVKHDEA